MIRSSLRPSGRRQGEKTIIVGLSHFVLRQVHCLISGTSGDTNTNVDYIIVYTTGEDPIRIIMARKANRREIRLYNGHSLL